MKVSDSFVFIEFLYWLNLKNCCVPEIGFVTVNWPLTTTRPGSERLGDFCSNWSPRVPRMPVVAPLLDRHLSFLR
jgi:hypothetical protein